MKFSWHKDKIKQSIEGANNPLVLSKYYVKCCADCSCEEIQQPCEACENKGEG